MIKKISVQLLLWGLVLILAIPFGAFAQNTAPPASPQFKQEELDQMLAPIALYPDSLLVQILMASTYPLEIVEAARWTKANQNLKGDPLTTALEKQNWDPSVKSLVNFPSVLAMMNDKLEWTQKLGDAFLSQEKGVMDTVQKLRAKAQAQGTLKSTDQQRVTTQAQTIIIEPASPQVVYIPAYNPAVVYGPWMYPAYPPYPYYPPGAVVGASVVSFGMGVAVGAAWGYAWGGCNWNHGSVNVNVNQNNTINSNINRNKYANNANVSQNNANINRNSTNKVGGGGSTEWQHDPAHRKGVAYRDNATQQKYGQQRDRGSTNARNDYRGHNPDDRGRTGQAKDRPGMQDRKDVQGRDRQDAQDRKGTPAQNRNMDSRQGSASAFDGMDRSGSEAKMQSDRGRASSQGMSSARDGGGSARSSGGGMSRSGGGRR
ncbi:MAG TPA: DUF3300 domain-containing protein [Syntrophus sp. (in: bacteria)]|nr:DUF3300 domain-containing protein [Syntrophus sp. (in: bacteria)]